MDRYELVRKSLGVHLAENTVERSTNGSYVCYYPVNAGSISYHSVRLNDLFMELHAVFILHHIMKTCVKSDCIERDWLQFVTIVMHLTLMHNY